MRTQPVVGLTACIALLFGCTGTYRTRGQTPRESVGGGTRRALLIANADYDVAGDALANPLADAKRIRRSLRKVGFIQHVQLETNLSKGEIAKAIDRFARSLKANDVAFIYYAGHGISLNNKTYLLGTDFDASNQVDAEYEAYPVQRVVDRLQGTQASIRVIVIDACRNVALPRSWNWARSTTNRNFAPVGQQTVLQGTLLAFAARGGQQALDGVPGVRGGPYAYALADQLVKPSFDIALMFRDVATRVSRLTGGKQEPEHLSQLRGRFSFVPLVEPPPPAPPPPPPATPRVLTGQNKQACRRRHAGNSNNLVRNGDFEDPPVPVAQYRLFQTGLAFGGWTVVGAPGNVAPLSGAYAVPGMKWAAQSGRQTLDLTGLSNSATGVSQSISTAPGKTYRLSFWSGNVVDRRYSYGTASAVEVVIEGLFVQRFTNTKGDGQPALGWEFNCIEFVANATTTRIRFVNLDSSSDDSNILDNVVMTAAP